MPELLLELLSEEIPARMQARAAADLERLVGDRLKEAGLAPEGLKAFATPRRLALVAAGLPARQPDRREEKKGPRVGAPEKAVEGFLRSAGLSSVEACETREDKKGAYYVAVIDRKGRPTAEIVAELVPAVVRDFAWPKSMRWGPASENDGGLRWVRPLHTVLCCFDGEIVDFEIDGVVSGDATRGHRFMAGKEIRVRTFKKYEAALRKAHVVLDADERKERILEDAKTLCTAQGLALVEDAGLLAEVAGLAEWPVAMIGAFDEKFLALPDEVLTAVMRGHQKYFSVQDPKSGRLANRFIFVANLETTDGGAAMRAGYERVLTARLSDAWFLYHQDLKTWKAKKSIDEFVEPLDRVTFFEGLGSIGDKTRRIAALAKEMAPAVGADPELAEKAALLAKADLVTGMVYEFPELQGVMGRYYYLAQHAQPSFEARPDGRAPQDEGGVSSDTAPATKPNPHPEVRAAQLRASKDGLQTEASVCEIADAIRDHYKPAGQDDDVPTAPVSVAVALADRIDTLTAFWAIDKKPTGSSDPFALRRASLGILRLCIDNELRVSLGAIFLGHLIREVDFEFSGHGLHTLIEVGAGFQGAGYGDPNAVIEAADEMRDDLLSFFHDRLKVYLRDKGHKYDAIDAVLTKADGTPEDDLVLIVRKLEALEVFLKTDDGANLAIAYKRAANILKAEEKTDGKPADPASVDAKKLTQAEEKTLFAALEAAEKTARAAVAEERFEDAMAALAGLRAPIDAFFDKVTVNADDEELRANRLSLLARFRAATAEVADLSKLEG